MQNKHVLDNIQACEEIQLAPRGNTYTKMNRLMEKRMEGLWQEFEKRGWTFGQFAAAVLEVLIVLDHRRLRIAGERSHKILNGSHDNGFDSTMTRAMAERALNAAAGLGEARNKNSRAVPVLRDKPAKRFRVLVVEDEAPLAKDIANILQNAGFEAVGPAAGPARALELVRNVGCDAAVLDVRLGSRTSEPVALALRERGTPFIAVSAYSRKDMPAGFIDSPLLDKPLQADLLLAHLRRCVAGQQGVERP